MTRHRGLMTRAERRIYEADQLDYLMSEVLFLRSQGEGPVMIAHMLGRDRDSLSRLAARHGRSDVVEALVLDYRVERAWRGLTFDNGQVA